MTDKTAEQQLFIKTCHLFCQHCKAIQKVTGITANCLYNPLSEDYEHAWCASCADAVKAILADLTQKIRREVFGEIEKLPIFWLNLPNEPYFIITNRQWDNFKKGFCNG